MYGTTGAGVPAMPNLRSARSLDLRYNPGQTASLPALQTLTDSALTVRSNTSLSMPSLTLIDRVLRGRVR